MSKGDEKISMDYDFMSIYVIKSLTSQISRISLKFSVLEKAFKIKRKYSSLCILRLLLVQVRGNPLKRIFEKCLNV